MGELTFLHVCRIKINGQQAVHLLLSVCKGFLHTIFAKIHLKHHCLQEELKQSVVILGSVSLLREYIENNDT